MRPDIPKPFGITGICWVKFMRNLQTLGHAEAQLALQTIVDELTRRGKAATIVVADAHGELLAFLRMDGAKLSTIKIAINKAYTAARERRPTREIGQKAVQDPSFDIAYYGDSHYVGWGGGLPVLVDGACVGSVAVSGLPEVEDMEVAALGVQVITSA